MSWSGVLRLVLEYVARLAGPGVEVLKVLLDPWLVLAPEVRRWSCCRRLWTGPGADGWFWSRGLVLESVAKNWSCH